MSVGRCCCAEPSWGTGNGTRLALWVWKELGTDYETAFGFLPEGVWSDAPTESGIVWEPDLVDQTHKGFGIISSGLPAAVSQARLRFDLTGASHPVTPDYVTANMRAWYTFTMPGVPPTVNVSTLQGSQLISWPYVYGATDLIIDITPIVLSMQADPIWVPLLDFQLVFRPEDQSLLDVWPQLPVTSPLVGGGWHFETLP